jgi:hypothetical protein
MGIVIDGFNLETIHFLTQRMARQEQSLRFCSKIFSSAKNDLKINIYNGFRLFFLLFIKSHSPLRPFRR